MGIASAQRVREQPRRRLLMRSVALMFAIPLVLPTLAVAQSPAYPAQPPSKGALYRDGQGGRYLLGGDWLYRADLGDVGVADGFWRGSASTEGWSPVSVPNSYNASDPSTASMDGWVGWYRKDFTLPRGAFARAVRAADQHWLGRVGAGDYPAPRRLEGPPDGPH